MKILNINLDEEPLFIAEIGVNHEGSLQQAKKLMRLAKEAGYHAAKFQLYDTKNFLSNFFEERVVRAESYALSIDDYKELKKVSKDISLPIFASAISHTMIDFLAADGVIKVASGDIDFHHMLDKLARTDSKIIMSIGASNRDEIQSAINVIKSAAKVALNEKLILLVCTSLYPCPIESANLARLTNLKEFGCRLGFSNHVLEEEAAFCAASLGASVFEFHFTDTREGKTFHDHLLSFDPEMSTQMFSKIRNIRMALGSGELTRSQAENENYKMLRKGLIYSRDLKQGHVLGLEDISYARPAIHYSCNDTNKVFNRKLKTRVYSGDLVKDEDLFS